MSYRDAKQVVFLQYVFEIFHNFVPLRIPNDWVKYIASISNNFLFISIFSIVTSTLFTNTITIRSFIKLNHSWYHLNEAQPVKIVRRISHLLRRVRLERLHGQAEYLILIDVSISREARRRFKNIYDPIKFRAFLYIPRKKWIHHSFEIQGFVGNAH